MATKPLSPNEVFQNKVFPDEVIQSVNELLIKHIRDYRNTKSASFTQKELEELINSKNSELTSQFLLNNNFLDIEPIYKEQGWTVVYATPSYGDNNHFDSYFKFTYTKP